MAFKTYIASSVVIFLLTQSVDSLLTSAKTTDESHSIDIGDQQISAQYYRPYNYGGNRRPVYPAYNYNQRPAVYNPRPFATTRRPSYPAPTTRRPNFPAPSNNYRPAAATAGRFPNGLCSASPNSYQQYGICWDAAAQRMQTSPNLSIENFVRFYINNLGNDAFGYRGTSKYYDAICDQSRRFNGVGIYCNNDGEDYCNDHHINGGGQNDYAAIQIDCWNDECICIVGDRYEELAATLIPGSSGTPYVVSNVPGGYTGPVTTQAIQNFVQQELAAAGIYWRP